VKTTPPSTPACVAGGGESLLGDFVFLDTNCNGIQDVGEVGVANITVILFNGPACKSPRPRPT